MIPCNESFGLNAGAPDELHIHHFDDHPSIIIIDAEKKEFDTDSKNFIKSSQETVEQPCPWCPNDTENTSHIIARCRQPTVVQARRLFLEKQLARSQDRNSPSPPVWPSQPSTRSKTTAPWPRSHTPQTTKHNRLSTKSSRNADHPKNHSATFTPGCGRRTRLTAPSPG